MLEASEIDTTIAPRCRRKLGMQTPFWRQRVSRGANDVAVTTRERNSSLQPAKTGGRVHKIVCWSVLWSHSWRHVLSSFDEIVFHQPMLETLEAGRVDDVKLTFPLALNTIDDRRICK
ncbi:hypothetical protein CA85_49550 [Allorhodopirellula solitaria]|uniref:Uncharacterized protein n=1 Tax=Allorhodopirellula solitaria TaxID=2527987 RepID=A0A5C5WZN1_9BACT|nr:hypothetical protein CA85_49550 [Allorhodopirellula solitaria]